MVLGRIGWVAVVLFLVSACSSDGDDGDDGGGGSTAALAASCHQNCDAQAAVMGCMQNVTPELCNALCDSSARDLPAECRDLYTAYYDCTVATGFECQASYVSQKTDACSDDAQALGSCQNGDETCEGA